MGGIEGYTSWASITAASSDINYVRIFIEPYPGHLQGCLIVGALLGVFVGVLDANYYDHLVCPNGKHHYDCIPTLVHHNETTIISLLPDLNNAEFSNYWPYAITETVMGFGGGVGIFGTILPTFKNNVPSLLLPEY